MDNRKIFELMKKFEQSQIAKMKLKDGEFSITLEKAVPVCGGSAPVSQTMSAPNVLATEESKEFIGKVIKSPIVGTFYAASSPEKPPFVKEGQRIHKGDSVCVIEAMKMFNEVVSEFDGVVKEILAQNGDNVEYGQPLIILE